MPVVDGKTIEEEEFNKLDESVKHVFEENSSIVQEQIIQILSNSKDKTLISLLNSEML